MLRGVINIKVNFSFNQMEYVDVFDLNINSDLDSMTADEFEEAWKLKPENKLILNFGGSQQVCPRYSVTYMKDYKFNANHVLFEKNLPPLFDRIFQAAKLREPRLNQALVNWYEDDGYIGFHSDNTRPLVPNSPIFSYSYGPAIREFHLKSKASNKVELKYILQHNRLIIMKGGCQERYLHSAIKSRVRDGENGRRINLTFRCFL